MHNCPSFYLFLLISTPIWNKGNSQRSIYFTAGSMLLLVELVMLKFWVEHILLKKQQQQHPLYFAIISDFQKVEKFVKRFPIYLSLRYWKYILQHLPSCFLVWHNLFKFARCPTNSIYSKRKFFFLVNDFAFCHHVYLVFLIWNVSSVFLCFSEP